MQSEPEEKEKNEQEAQPKKARRFFASMGRTLFWIIVITAGWWFLSSMMPGLPGPGSALKAGFRVAKNATDGVYFWVKKGSLEQAAEQVREAAVEHGPED
ncbi:MAG: hypothetical protein WC824_10350, partial [Bacteroidota bacterium]